MDKTRLAKFSPICLAFHRLPAVELSLLVFL